MMDECRIKLENLQEQRDKEIAEFLEKHTEEKFTEI